jgi:N12 class adenine-specific DNA methylase
MTRVAGLPQTASERAFDLFLKVQHIKRETKEWCFSPRAHQSQTRWPRCSRCSATLQMETLRRNSAQHFDSWAGAFGETVTSMELSPDGSGIVCKAVSARFVNVPS